MTSASVLSSGSVVSGPAVVSGPPFLVDKKFPLVVCWLVGFCDGVWSVNYRLAVAGRMVLSRLRVVVRAPVLTAARAGVVVPS